MDDITRAIVQQVDDLSEKLIERNAEIKRLLDAIRKNAEETDYCILCDNHPSHGHAKDCPLAEGAA